MDSPAKPPKTKPLAFFLRLTALVLVLSVIVFLLDLQSLKSALAAVSLKLILTLAVLEWLFFAVESLRIRWLARNQYSFMGIYRARFISTFLSNIFPGMIFGEIIRLFLIDRQKPGNKFFLMLVLFASRLYGLFTLGLVFIAAVVIDPGFIQTHIGLNLPLLVLLAILPLFSPFLVRIPLVRFVMWKVIRRFHGSLRKVFRKLGLAANLFSRPREWALASLTSIGTNAISIFQFWLIGEALGLNFSVQASTVITTLVGISAFLPLGIGAYGTQDSVLALTAAYTGEPLEKFVVLSIALHICRLSGGLPGLLLLGECKQVLKEVTGKASSGIRILKNRTRNI